MPNLSELSIADLKAAMEFTDKLIETSRDTNVLNKIESLKNLKFDLHSELVTRIQKLISG